MQPPVTQLDAFEFAAPEPAARSASAAGRVRRRAWPAIRRPSPASPVRPRSPERRLAAAGSCRSGGSWTTARPRRRRSAACRAASRARRSRRGAGSAGPSSVTSRFHSLRNGMGASAGTSRLPERLRSCSSLIADSVGSLAARRLEFQRLEQLGRELAQRPVAVGGADAADLPRQDRRALRTSPRTRSSLAQPTVSSTTAKPSRSLLWAVAERFDRAVEQAHQAADIPRAGDVAPFLGLPRPREQAADQLVRHVEHSIGQAGFEVDDSGDQDRAPPVRGIAPDLVSVGDPTFADELLEAVIVDPRGGFGGQADVADEAQPIDQLADVVRLRRARRIALSQANGVASERRIDGRAVVELGDLHFARRRRAAHRRRACARGRGRRWRRVRSPPAPAGSSSRHAARRSRRQRSAGPRSVLQADCAAASIMNGRSAALGGRNPSAAARTRA